jgi:hypothetical protein
MKTILILILISHSVGADAFTDLSVMFLRAGLYSDRNFEAKECFNKSSLEFYHRLKDEHFVLIQSVSLILAGSYGWSTYSCTPHARRCSNL